MSSRAKKTKSGTVLMSVDYYQPVFALLHSHLLESGYPFGKIHPIRESFWRLVPDGRYEPEWGREIISKYLVSVEGELKTILSKHSVAYWLHAYRRLLPRPIGDNRSPETVIWVRSILESACQKYASLIPCDGVGVSGQIPDEKILSGMLLHPDLKIILDELHKTPQLVLTNFDSFSLGELYQAEKLAYEVWKAGAILRALGKGAPFVVSKAPADFFDDRNDELHALLAHYDSRHHSFDASSTGTVFYGDSNSKSDTVFFPRYDVAGVSEKIPAKFWEMFGLRFVEPFVSNFVWFPVNLKAYMVAHEPFAADFESRNGVSLSSIFAILGALALEVYYTWKNIHGRVLNYWQRAYAGPDKKSNIIALIAEYLPLSISNFDLNISPSSIDILKTVDFLSLTQSKKDSIDVSLGGPHFVFVPYDNERVFIDYAWITEILRHLFYGVTVSDQNFKGTALESYVRLGQSALPTGELKGKDGKSKQVDAAFAVGKFLVITECRAKAYSLGMLRGDPVAIQHRKDLINTLLSEADTKANWLAKNPVGKNYDITKYSHILPLAVSPFAEFIPSLNTHYWIKPQIPRVLTPEELRGVLKKQIIKGCDNLISIEKEFNRAKAQTWKK
jgi:hypothetical protein